MIDTVDYFTNVALLSTLQLHVAACNGYMLVGEFLLKKMVAVSPVDNDSWTPIHHAALWKQVSDDFPACLSNYVIFLAAYKLSIH